MEVAGGLAVARPLSEVADVLGDVGRLAACVPGVRRVSVAADGAFEAEVLLELPFARLPTTVDGRLGERRPDGLSVSLRGRPRTLAGAFSAAVDLTWREDGEGSTRIDYRMTVALQGRLASLGEAMVRSTSEAKGREFEQALAALFESP